MLNKISGSKPHIFSWLDFLNQVNVIAVNGHTFTVLLRGLFVEMTASYKMLLGKCVYAKEFFIPN